MKEVLKKYGSYVLGIAIIIFVSLSILFKNNNFIDNLDGAISLTLFLCFIYYKYLWKYNPFDKIPKIYGNYEANLISDFDKKKRKIKLEIKQDLLSTRIYMESKESKSESISSNLIKEEDGWKLIYAYNNLPNAKERHHSEIHYGTCVLEIKNNKILKGTYYTDRKTLGDIENIKKYNV